MNNLIKRTDFGVYVMVNDTHLSRWVEQEVRLDHAHIYLENFRHHIPIGGTVIDCGTSIGDHTVTYASMVGPEGTVLGFEANPDVAECCALNLGIYPWARIHNVGLSDDVGVSGIDVSPNVGASSLNSNGREVMLTPLDQWTSDLKRVDFIKVDVEGYEARLLMGARETIKKFSPVILMEINHGALNKQGFKPDDVLSLLSGNGYTWSVADGQYGTPQYDILAVKK